MYQLRIRQLIRLGGHDEIVLMQTTNLMRPPLHVQIASNHKTQLLLLPG